jgi:hypothetical protein
LLAKNAAALGDIVGKDRVESLSRHEAKQSEDTARDMREKVALGLQDLRAENADRSSGLDFQQAWRCPEELRWRWRSAEAVVVSVTPGFGPAYSTFESGEYAL